MNYILGLYHRMLKKHYTNCFQTNSFVNDTLESGERLINAMSEKW